MSDLLFKGHSTIRQDVNYPFAKDWIVAGWDYIFTVKSGQWANCYGVVAWAPDGQCQAVLPGIREANDDEPWVYPVPPDWIKELMV